MIYSSIHYALTFMHNNLFSSKSVSDSFLSLSGMDVMVQTHENI